MPQGRSGISSTTPDYLALDAGEVYFGIDETALVDASASDPVGDALASAIAVGATRGGSVFDSGRTIRDIEMDGKLGPTKGLRRRQSVSPVLTIRFAEITIGNLVKAIAGASSAAAGSFEKITGGEIGDSSYIDNIALLATTREATDPIVLVLQNVLVVDPVSLSTADEDEMVVEAAFAAHFDPATPTTEPWAVYHPGTPPA